MTDSRRLASAALIGPVEPPGLHVMSFNIRRRMPHRSRRSPDRWRRREPLITRLLRAEQPALLGVQEAMPDQEDAVLHALGPRYRSLGYGRRPGKDGERSPLFYDSTRLELLEWRQRALSDTPDVPGSTGWGNWIPRVVVSAEFRDTATGQPFAAINTHLDHLSRASRLTSAGAIRRLALASDLPALVTGDFNTDTGSRPYREITAERGLADTWLVAEEKVTASWGSFPNYREPKVGAKRIDWILATPTFAVIRAAVNVTRFDGDWPSDHAPVQAVVRLGGS